MNKDSITKKLFEDKEVFASFINGVIYQGKKILSSHHLKEINLSTISDSFKERIRDIVQVYQTGDEIFPSITSKVSPLWTFPWSFA